MCIRDRFQSHLLDTTIFQTKSLDVLSEFALLVSCVSCSANSAELSRESEKMSHKKTAFLAELPDRHDAIACISSAYKWMPTQLS